jgi:hypothetical protein
VEKVVVAADISDSDIREIRKASGLLIIEHISIKIADRDGQQVGPKPSIPDGTPFVEIDPYCWLRRSLS